MYYAVSQAAVLLGVHTQTIRRWIYTLNVCGDHVRPSDGLDLDDEGSDDKP